MASENRVIQKMLEEAGYRLIRQKNHPVYSNGVSQIVMPRGLITSPRMRHWIRSQLRKRENQVE